MKLFSRMFSQNIYYRSPCTQNDPTSTIQRNHCGNILVYVPVGFLCASEIVDLGSFCLNGRERGSFFNFRPQSEAAVEPIPPPLSVGILAPFRTSQDQEVPVVIIGGTECIKARHMLPTVECHLKLNKRVKARNIFVWSFTCISFLVSCILMLVIRSTILSANIVKYAQYVDEPFYTHSPRRR